jgi:hypothetical protein
VQATKYRLIIPLRIGLCGDVPSYQLQLLIGDGDAVYVTHVNKGLHAAGVVTVR